MICFLHRFIRNRAPIPKGYSLAKMIVKRFIYQMTHYYYYFSEVVEEYRLFFRNPDNKHLEGVNLRRSFLHVVFPSFLCFFFGCRGVFVIFHPELVETKSDGLWYFTAHLPFKGRPFCEFTFFIVATYVWAFAIYVQQTKLLEMTLFAVFAVDTKPDSVIRPKDLGFKRTTWDTFIKQRTSQLKITHIMVLGVNFVASSAICVRCFQESLPQMNFFLWAYWYWHFNVWLHVASVGKYHARLQFFLD